MNPARDSMVYIVDDDEDVRDALAMLMRASGLKCETFANAGDFLLRQRPQGLPSCLVLDVRMPGMTGIELQAELQRRRLRIPVIFLTGHGDVPLAVRAMKAGAVDFIQKPLDQHRLVVAVKAALELDGSRALPAEGLDAPAGDDRLADLTRRELDVVEMLKAGKQNKEIARALGISIKTVEFHRSNIRSKLGASSLPDLFRIVFDRGGDREQ